MARPFVVSQSDYVASVPISAGGVITATLPFHQANDILVVVCDLFPFPNTASVPVTPSGWNAATATTYAGTDRLADGNASVVWWWRRAVDGSTLPPDITIPTHAGLVPGAHVSVTAFVVRGCTTGGDPFEGRGRSGIWVGGDDMAHIAVTSTYIDATAIAIVTGVNSSIAAVGASPAGFTTKSIRYAYAGEGATCAILSRDIDVATIPAAYTGYQNTEPGTSTAPWGIVFTFVAIPTADVGVDPVPVTAIPIRGMARGTLNPPLLGCADEYEAIITGNDYESRIDAVRWSSIKWERVLDEVSTAEVTVPDEFGGVSCIAKYGGLVPWRYGMTIERNGQPVWKGPVTGLSRKGGSITVSCSDAFARFKRRLATRTESLRYVANDAGQMFADILNTHGRVPQDAWTFRVPQPNIGVAITRNVVAREFNMAWDTVEDLLDSAIDAYVLAGDPVVFQPGVGWLFVGALDEQYYLNTEQALATLAGGDTVYGLFTQEAFAETPDWSINGMLQANTGWVVGADSGQAGFRKYWSAQIGNDLAEDSVLDMVETVQLYRAGEDEEELDDSVFQRRVDSLVALRAIAPAIIDSVSLTPEAPVNVENLRPGSIWTMDVYDAGWGQLLGAGRVKRITGSITAGGSEQIAATLQPIGYSEEDL